MASFPWFRMYSEARNDPKLESLPDDQFRVWFRLLCLASETKERGSLPEADYLLAVNCAKGDEALLERTIASLVKLRIIAQDDDVLFFRAFASRQYGKPSDAPDATSERKRRQRERDRVTRKPAEDAPAHSNVTPMSRDVTRGHDPDTDTERDTEDEGLSIESNAREKPEPKKADPKPKRRSQLPEGWTPSEKQRDALGADGFSGAEIDAECAKFVNHHIHKGDVGLDWPRAFANWMARSRDFAAPRGPTRNGSPPRHDHNGQRLLTSADLRRIAEGEDPDEPKRNGGAVVEAQFRVAESAHQR